MKRGPKTDDGAVNLKRCQVMLDKETLRIMRLRGNGNLSLGIRLSAHCTAVIYKGKS